MAEHAEVFISGTTRDLGSYRRTVKDALLTKSIFPIEETNFALAYGPLTDILRALIRRCDARHSWTPRSGFVQPTFRSVIVIRVAA
jgi:Domain of unknown function (DUF4062)